MTYLLDSHAFVWAADDPSRLSVAARTLIGDPATRLAVSVASLWELSLKASRGRLTLPEPFDRFADAAVRAFDLEVVPVHRHHVEALADLPQISSDPFDRMLVAQSLSEGMPLITVDRELAAYPIETIW